MSNLSSFCLEVWWLTSLSSCRGYLVCWGWWTVFPSDWHVWWGVDPPLSDSCSKWPKWGVSASEITLVVLSDCDGAIKSCLARARGERMEGRSWDEEGENDERCPTRSSTDRSGVLAPERGVLGGLLLGWSPVSRASDSPSSGSWEVVTVSSHGRPVSPSSWCSIFWLTGMESSMEGVKRKKSYGGRGRADMEGSNAGHCLCLGLQGGIWVLAALQVAASCLHSNPRRGPPLRETTHACCQESREETEKEENPGFVIWRSLRSSKSSANLICRPSSPPGNLRTGPAQRSSPGRTCRVWDDFDSRRALRSESCINGGGGGCICRACVCLQECVCVCVCVCVTEKRLTRVRARWRSWQSGGSVTRRLQCAEHQSPKLRNQRCLVCANQTSDF